MSYIEAWLSCGGSVRGEPDAVATAVAIDRDMRSERQRWIADLRAAGVKASHPDDGWVDRRANTVHLAYPQFNDGLEAGDVLALGWPWNGHRLVRVVGYDPGRFGLGRWRFESLEASES